MRRVVRTVVWMAPVAFLSLSAYAYTWSSPAAAPKSAPAAERSLPSAPAAQQAPSSPVAGYVPPKTAHGQPDLEGVWRVWSVAGHDLEPHSASYETPAGLGVIVDPPDQLIPYKPWAKARRDENYKASRIKIPYDPVASADPLGKCYLPGVPRITYLGYPFQIFQAPDEIIFMFEWNHAKRQIPLNSTAERLRGLEFFMGVPRGRFEGNTLVVESTNFNDATWLDRAGNFFTRTARVVERYTPVGPNEMRYDVTIEDPRVYTRPWSIRMPIHRQDTRLLEYECVQHLEEAGRPPVWDRQWDTLIDVPNE